VFGVPQGGGTRGGPCIRFHLEHFNQNGQWQEVKPKEGPTREAQGDQEGACHILVREHVLIAYQNWRKVPEDLKDKVWRDVKKPFEYPSDQFNEDLCKGHAMVIIGKVLRNLRSKLNKNYV
jgi:hypothetical protein